MLKLKCSCKLTNSNNNNNNNTEIWSCTYSPEQDLIAWSDRNGTINIINFKELDLNKKLDEHKNKQQVNSVNNLLEVDVGAMQQTINCGESVWSIAFGSSKSQVKYKRIQYKHVKRVNTRFKLDDLLILAVGLESGRIRIYDAIARSLLFVLHDHKDIVRDLKFAKNGSFQLASVSRDETIKVRKFN